MTKFSLHAALWMAAVMVIGPTPAWGQLNYGNSSSATSSLLTNIQNSSVGGGAFSISAINNQVLTQSRAFAASAGIGAPVPTANSSISGRGARVPTFGGGRSGAKPFANVRPDSTVSPYLSLFNETASGQDTTIDNYNVLVRPRLQQQATNRALQRQAQQLNARVQSISAQSAFQARGSEQVMATGHQTAFGFYSRYYPQLNGRRR